MGSIKYIPLQIVFIIITIANTWGAALERVDDSDLVHLLTGEERVVVLFTKNNCPECDEMETLVENMQSDLKQGIGAVVVKAHNSNLVSIYDPTREPSLIYFRRGMPLLYYGDFTAFDILQTFSDNPDPIVKELSDENFEHLTQAGSGATTGDWFVFFYSADCVLCQRLYAVWEGVGVHLRRRLNVARVNRLEAGISTAKRFGIVESPEFVLLRHGKIYRYKVKDYTPKSFVEFAEKGFSKQTDPELVSPEAQTIDLNVMSILDLALANPALIAMAVAMLLLIVVYRCLTKKPKTAKNANKKSK